jgi:hypothetical protein
VKLAKAVQIATEAISLQRQKIAFDANMLKVYHVDNIKTRACTELFQKYSDAINLLNSLVTEAAADQPPLVTTPTTAGAEGMETESAAAADNVVPNVVPAAGPPGASNSVTTQEELIYRDIERRLKS